MKEQVFEYQWEKTRNGSMFISSRDVRHAICNSDQYPVPPGGEKTPEWEVQNGAIEAVINAVSSAPRYECHMRLMVDAEKMAGILDGLADGNSDRPGLSPEAISELLLSAAEYVEVLQRESNCICDCCKEGRKAGCGHAAGRHYDVWGEGLGKPDYCPQKGGDLPW